MYWFIAVCSIRLGQAVCHTILPQGMACFHCLTRDGVFRTRWGCIDYILWSCGLNASQFSILGETRNDIGTHDWHYGLSPVTPSLQKLCLDYYPRHPTMCSISFNVDHSQTCLDCCRICWRGSGISLGVALPVSPPKHTRYSSRNITLCFGQCFSKGVMLAAGRKCLQKVDYK